MISTLWASKSGMNANQEKLDAISNNIANVNTFGYKKVDVGFKDLLARSLDSLGTPINNKNAVTGTGVRTGEWYRDNGQGGLQPTNNNTDIAIDGQGYYRIIGDDGSVFYTRDGAFQVNVLGQIVANNGKKLDIQYEDGYNENNAKLSRENLFVDKDGSIYLKDNDKFTKVAEIPVYTAIGDKAFTSIGENLFVLNNDATAYRTRDANFCQGFLEGSNVDMGQEFTEMILTQRAFQLSSKGITVADEMWGMANSLRK